MLAQAPCCPDRSVRHQWLRRCWAAAGAVLLAGLLAILTTTAARAAPAAQACDPVIATSTADSGPGSLRQAVADTCDGGTVDFAPGLSGQTITFASQILLSKDVTIRATAPITLSGNNAARLFEISPGRTVTLSGLALIDGNPGAFESGGAVSNNGVLTVRDSTFAGNTADESGGAIYNSSGSTLTVERTAFRSNTAGSSGAGIVNFGSVTVTAGSFFTNTAGNGGAIQNIGDLKVYDSTFSGNTATVSGGGAIYNANGMTLEAVHSTFSANSGPYGGGIFSYGPATLTANVLSANTATQSGGGDTCLAGVAFTSGGYNVVTDDTCGLGGTNDISSAPPQTRAAQPNGTAPLLLGAAAIGNVTDANLCTGVDQLGNTRQPAPCDAGAAEFVYVLTITAAGTGSGVTNPAVGAHAYRSGEQATVTATPAASSTFGGWSGDCTGTGSCTLTMSADRAIVATFTLKRYNLQVTKTGSGTVTSSPAGIDCGSSCAASFDHGTSVTLTPTPATGYTFTGWSGACSGTDACSVTMDAAKTVVATFTINSYNLTVATTGSGTVTSSPAGIDCGATCTAAYTHGTSVTLTPAAAAGYRFTGWSGACSGTKACTVTMDAAKNVGATFTIRSYGLTVTKTGSGTVASSPAGIDCGSTCTAAYTYGTVVTLTPTPATGYTFAGWSGACSGSGACAVTMDAAKNVVATFTVNSYSLTVATTGSGTVASSPPGIDCGATCTAPFTHGTVVTLTPTPATGYTFTGWSGACSGSGACAVTMDAARNVVATFTINRYALTVDKSGSGTVTSSPAGIDCGSTCTALFNHGASVTLTAIPATDHTFTGWSGACSGTGACSVTMDAVKLVAAVFWLKTYPVTYDANGAAGGKTPEAQIKVHGQPLTLQTNSGGLVKTGQVFAGWNTQADGRGTDYAAGATYSDNAPLALYAKWSCAVTNSADSGPGSLRQAVAAAPPGAVICFAPTLAGQTITLGSQIVLDKKVTISGTVPINLSGNGATRLFEIKPGADVHLFGLTLRDGKAEKGGAIYSADANLRVENSSVLNSVAQAGGGIYLVDSAKSHTLAIQNSTLAGNRAEVMPGGQAAAAAPGLALAGGLGVASVFGLAGFGPGAAGRKRRRLLAPFLGLMIFILVVGAACNIGVSTNSGGAVYVESGTANISFSTLAYNSAGEGAAIFNQINDSTDKGLVSGGWVLVSRSVLSQNTGTACNSNPAILSGGFNAVSDASCNFAGEDDHNNAGVQLQPLQANGTAPLMADSAAVELVANECLNTDQLGNARPDIYCGAGAVEFKSAGKPRLNTSLRAGLGVAFQGDKYAYTVTVENRGRGEATGLQVSLPLPNGLAYDTVNPTWTDGMACTWAAPTLLCTSPLGRDCVIVLTVPVKITSAAAEGAQLETTATAQAAAPASPSTASLVVTSMGPVPPTVGEGHTYRTIQEAVNAVPAGTTILVYPGTYVENVTVAKNVTIRGVEGAARTIVDGDQKGRVFTINAGVVTLDGLTVRNGGNTENGGGIWNDGVLTVNRSVVRGNTATNFGGGIYNLVQLTINDTVIEGNTATHWGGGIFNSESTPLAINDTVIESNTSKGDGGGLMNYGNATISNTIFSRNTALQRGGGYISMIGTTIIVINSTVAFNEAKMGGGSFHWSATETVRNSIFWGNKSAGTPDIYVYNKGTLTIRNSVMQARGDGEAIIREDPFFMRSPSGADPGDFHLATTSWARVLGKDCPPTDRDGKTRPATGCSAGAYEFQAATAGGGGMAALDAAAAEQATFPFSSSDGAVTLAIPSSAVTQTVHLAFSLGNATGGDGRSRSVVFTPYDDAGSPLPPDWGFLQPALLTLAYDPALIHTGLAIDLLPMRFEPATGSWLPFTRDVVIDQAARTVAFPIRQGGEYGLFSMPPGAYASLAAYSPAGAINLDGGTVVTYTLAAFNNDGQPLRNLALAHSLPPGLIFSGWVNANGASFDNGAITWNIPILPSGGVQIAAFAAQVSSDAAWWGQPITSTVTMSGPGGLGANGEAVVSVNGPPTAVDDSATTRPGQPVTLWPLLNDLNPDGSTLRLVGLGGPSGGAAAIVGGTVVYTPTAGFEGIDTFTYGVQDGQFNVEGTIRVRVAPLAFLGVMQTATHNGQDMLLSQTVPPNGVVAYTLQLFNSEEGEIAQNAVLTNVLPSGLQFTGWITQSGATLEGNTITWSAGSVPTGTVTTISFAARLVAAPGETVTNTVGAVAANADPVSASAAIVVGGAPELLHLYLPLAARDAGGVASEAPPVDTAPLDAAPGWDDAEATEHTYLPSVLQHPHDD